MVRSHKSTKTTKKSCKKHLEPLISQGPTIDPWGASRGRHGGITGDSDKIPTKVPKVASRAAFQSDRPGRRHGGVTGASRVPGHANSSPHSALNQFYLVY